jgi:hypothetical protein
MPWHYRENHQIRGPISSVELREEARLGVITPDTLLSLDQQKWVRAESVKGITFKQPEVPGPVEPAPLFELDHQTFRYLLWEGTGDSGGGFWITEGYKTKQATRDEVAEVWRRLEEVRNPVDYLSGDGWWRWWDPRLYRLLRD